MHNSPSVNYSHGGIFFLVRAVYDRIILNFPSPAADGNISKKKKTGNQLPVSLDRGESVIVFVIATECASACVCVCVIVWPSSFTIRDELPRMEHSWNRSTVIVNFSGLGRKSEPLATTESRGRVFSGGQFVARWSHFLWTFSLRPQKGVEMGRSAFEDIFKGQHQAALVTPFLKTVVFKRVTGERRLMVTLRPPPPPNSSSTGQGKSLSTLIQHL